MNAFGKQTTLAVEFPGGLPRRHDQVMKLTFSEVDMLRSALVHGLDARWPDRVDFSTANRSVEQMVGPLLVRRHADAVWRAWFRDRSRSVVSHFEFQSESDAKTGPRLLTYATGIMRELVASDALDPGGLLPHFVSIVVYNGPTLWKAPTMEEYCPAFMPELAGRRLRYEWDVLDLKRAPATRFPELSPLGLLASLERDSTEGNQLRVLRMLRQHYGGERHAGLRTAFRAWVLAYWRSMGVSEETVREAESLKEETMFTHGQELLAQWRKEGIADRWIQEGLEKGLQKGLQKGMQRGLEQGLEQGLHHQRELVVRMASRKFGTATAERLARALRESSDPDRVVEVGDAVMDCNTEQELLDRANGSPADAKS